MDKKKLVLLFSGIFITGRLLAAEVVNVPVDQLFIPQGFDSNDNVEVVVSGHLPNLCYKSPYIRIVSKNDKEIVLKVEATYQAPADQSCAEMIVPFLETFSLGILDSGNYKVKVNALADAGQNANLKIAEATSNAVDQFIYAQVDYIEKSSSSRTVILAGYNPSECLELEKIVVEHNGKDTFSILPIMRQTSDFCPMKMVPFKYEVEVPKVLAADIVLLHVRSLEGKSVNTAFPNYLH